MWGNCYAEIVRNGYGDIIQLWPITPNRVRMEIKEGELIYNINVGAEEIPLGRNQILHIPGLGFDGLQGYSVIAMARKSLGLGMALETFGALYFGQGTHPGLVVSHPNKLSPETRGNLESALNTQYSGLGNSNRLMLLDDGLKPEKIGIPPNDSQFIESRTFQISDVARWFHMPVHRLRNLDRATNNNIEAEQISWVVDTLLPWCIRLEQCFDQQLLTEPEKVRQFLYLRHNLDGQMRGNSTDRANYYKIMTSIGGMTINDVRRKENFDPFSDSYADEPFIAINNMIPLSKIDEYIANQAKQSTTKTSAPKEDTNANIP
jgi:HK97 family phage portal protein